MGWDWTLSNNSGIIPCRRQNPTGQLNLNWILRAVIQRSNKDFPLPNSPCNHRPPNDRVALVTSERGYVQLTPNDVHCVCNETNKAKPTDLCLHCSPSNRSCRVFIIDYLLIFWLIDFNNYCSMVLRNIPRNALYWCIVYG